MANNYYTFTPPFVPGTKVRSDEMNIQLSAIENAFDTLPSNTTAITRGATTLGTESGTGNTYVVTLTDTRTAYADGDQITFQATHTNTGAVTMNVDTVGAVAMVRSDGSALEANDIQTGLFYDAVFDSSNNRYQLLGPSTSFLTNASLRVDWAEEWAIQPEDTPVTVAAGGDGATTFSSLHWAAKAAASASAASTSEANAATSETNSGLNVGYAAEWATKAIDSLISVAAGGDGASDYSALHWADGAAQAWAIQAEDSAIQTSFGGDGATTFSAFHWAKKAEAFAASANVPTIGAGDADKFIQVNPGETGYELHDLFGSNNTFTSNQTFLNNGIRLILSTTTDGASEQAGINFMDGTDIVFDVVFTSGGTAATNLWEVTDILGNPLISVAENSSALVTSATDITFGGSSLIVPAASETVAGKIEIATQTEVNTGTDDVRAVTPLKFASRVASETLAGIIEIATQTEVNTGTDTTRAVTPATLANATSISSAGRLIDVQVFTSSGTWTKPANAGSVEVIAVGGGGGGGGTTQASTGAFRVAGSGGGGGFVSGFNLASNLAATETVTVGGGGTAGNGSTAATGGGLSSFSSGANLLRGNGGAAGIAGTVDNTVAAAGTGGATTQGGNVTDLVRINGDPGASGAGSTLANGNFCLSGVGGASGNGMGGGGQNKFINTVTRFNGTAPVQGYGGGGSGGMDNGQNVTTTVGGSGGSGIVIVKTYS